MEKFDVPELPEAEPTLAKGEDDASWYAHWTRKPFPAGEPIIAQYPMMAFLYAIEVLKARFPEGEPAIQKRPSLWNAYREELGF
jgi:hypothetical protein